MKLSIVDLSTVIPGETRHDALMKSIQVAKHIEKLGFTRVWVAEHHATAALAGRAPEVLISAIAAHTSTIRVGSGSVLLNHYSSLKVAEVFATLNELYPGRIDLGAGRATTGPVTDYALQQDRSQQFRADSDQQIVELIAWLENDFPENHPFQQAPLYTIDNIPKLYLLGSSSWSATAAAQLGLPYVFAGFINQRGTPDIIKHYQKNFEPARGATGVERPTTYLSVHAICADTEEEARRQIAPVMIMYQNLQKGQMDAQIPTPDKAVQLLGGLPNLDRYQPGTGIPPKFIAGTADQVHDQLSQLAADLEVEELIIQDLMTDHQARLRSYELFSDVFKLTKTK